MTVQPFNGYPVNFRFVVMGDSRGKKRSAINEDIFCTLLGRIKTLSRQPSFILFLGDMVLGGYSVTDQLNSWKEIFCRYFTVNHCIPIIGNHEGDETAFSNVFNYLPNSQLAGYQRTAYYFDYLNARFISLNSIRINKKGDYTIEPNQLRWLEYILRGNNKRYCFVSLHVPPFPTGAHYGKCLDADPVLRNVFWALIDRHNVTCVLAAHEHNYSNRIIDSSFAGYGYRFTNNIHQVITGGAGAPLDSSLKDSKSILKGPIGVYHCVVVDVYTEGVLFNAFDINGNHIDSFKIP